MKYIRTENAIYKIYTNIYNQVLVINIADENDYTLLEDFEKGKVIKQADTIEELFMPNDLLVVGDDKNQMPIFIESIEYLKWWLYNHDIYKIKEFYIKNDDDFKCVAKANKEGVLCLI